MSICRLDEAGVYCVGCLRTLDEIRRWPMLDEAARAEIVERLARTTVPSDRPFEEPSS